MYPLGMAPIECSWIAGTEKKRCTSSYYMSISAAHAATDIAFKLERTVLTAMVIVSMPPLSIQRRQP